MKFTLLPLLVLLTLNTSLASEAIEGFAEPYREIELAASEMGTIATVSAKEGDSVQAGQLIAGLDNRVLLVSLELAKEAANAKGKLAAAVAELELQRERYEKLMGLRQRNHASQVEVDRAAAQLRIAEAQFQAAHEEQGMKEIELRRIQAQLEQRLVRSPINGVVTSVSKDKGEFVSPSDPVIAKVIQLDPLLVVFSVTPHDAANLKKQQPVSVYFAQASREVDGVVEFVSPLTDPQSNTRQVKVRVANPQKSLQSGDACELVLSGRPRATQTQTVSLEGKSE